MVYGTRNTHCKNYNYPSSDSMVHDNNHRLTDRLPADA